LLFQPSAFKETVPEEPAPEATGQADAGPASTDTIADGNCHVEVGSYNPAFWDAPPYVQENNNSYAYSCNMRTSTSPQPGRYAKQHRDRRTGSGPVSTKRMTKQFGVPNETSSHICDSRELLGRLRICRPSPLGVGSWDLLVVTQRGACDPTYIFALSVLAASSLVRS
jgi:hypothetical protein